MERIESNLKTCESCGKPFVCRPEGGCWCAAVHVDAEVRECLGRKYRDCLCPVCLTAHATRTRATDRERAR